MKTWIGEHMLRMGIFFYYPVTPLACHPFINEGEVPSYPFAHFFPFIDEGVDCEARRGSRKKESGEVPSYPFAHFFPFIDEGVARQRRDGVVEKRINSTIPTLKL